MTDEIVLPMVGPPVTGEYFYMLTQDQARVVVEAIKIAVAGWSAQRGYPHEFDEVLAIFLGDGKR